MVTDWKQQYVCVTGSGFNDLGASVAESCLSFEIIVSRMLQSWKGGAGETTGCMCCRRKVRGRYV